MPSSKAPEDERCTCDEVVSIHQFFPKGVKPRCTCNDSDEDDSSEGSDKGPPRSKGVVKSGAPKQKDAVKPTEDDGYVEEPTRKGGRRATQEYPGDDETAGDDAPSKKPVEDDATSKKPAKDDAPAKKPVKDDAPAKKPVEDDTPGKKPAKDDASGKKPVEDDAPAKKPAKDDAPGKAPAGDDDALGKDRIADAKDSKKPKESDEGDKSKTEKKDDDEDADDGDNIVGCCTNFWKHPYSRKLAKALIFFLIGLKIATESYHMLIPPLLLCVSRKHFLPPCI